ncbi:MAG: plasmid stabilization protein [Lentisphaerae bacterium RIFOXYB12_FULL_65_16]|nr:MAG: plasmid stabilization protein [Lentisphaerae bacterium RIFOXYA12_64_32]OGV84145.1 MAG: plasmid stabilization protein [Lentisphaerae bacterium RIFOXYB12_FULL_65_16]
MSDVARRWTLIRTEAFLRELRKYLRTHPDRQELVRDTLTALVSDPFTPALRLHPLKGRMQGLHAVRLSYSDRIIITLLITKRQIVLLGIGTHDEVYR